MKIFISSVQKEFAAERKALAKMIREDRWLGGFFDVFIFEECSAKTKMAQKVYLDAVAESDIYIGLIGDAYGNVDREGVSPTEREYDKATELGKDRLINPGCLPKGTTVQDLLISHDSNPRNHVIARAMSWTNYVEKSGSGTGEIIRLCREAGLADPEFESMTGHFKTIIWRRGYGKVTDVGPEDGPSRGAQINGSESLGPSEDPTKGPSRMGRVLGPRKRAQKKGPEKAQKRLGPEKGGAQKMYPSGRRGPADVVQLFSNGGDLSMSMIARGLGGTSASGYLKRMVASMCEDGVLMTTKPPRARNRFQSYRLTFKGRALAEKLAKKGKAVK